LVSLAKRIVSTYWSAANVNPQCSIVIATYNRCAVLRQTLSALCDLPARPRIVVVDNASTDDTENTCKAFGSRVLFLKLRRNIGAAARTIGVREAETPFVAFCDDDCVWLPGALERAVQRFMMYGDVAVLNARVLVGDGERTDPACEAMRTCATGSEDGGVPIVYFMAGASIVRTNAFLQAGGYNERYFIGAEESLLSLDLAAQGWRLWYCDDLLIRHKPSPLNRDSQTRRRLVLRNRLWTALLRFSLPAVLATLADHARMATRDPIVRAALGEALTALPWIVRERRAIPRQLERRVRALDHAHAL
jgi:GT2 family glycosyltransferase